MARDDHDLGVELPLAHPRQRRQAVHPGEPDIEQHDVVGLTGQTLEARLAAVDGVDAVALVAQHSAERAADARFVIDDQNGRHTSCRSDPFRRRKRCGRFDAGAATRQLERRQAGNSIANRVPRGWLSVTSMLPPCSATMRRTMARPRPLPRCFVE